MKKTKSMISVLLIVCVILNINFVFAKGNDYKDIGFELISKTEISDLGAEAYHFRHIKTGAEIIFLDNDSQMRQFSIGFKTPPSDSKGTNHVLEHSLLCGSDKYPTKNLMNYVRSSSLADMINAYTSDDCTYYTVETINETEYYNIMDIHLNGVFHPLILKDENIFRQQGIRKEYVDGNVQYNGVVYNELRINSLESTENSINFLADKLYRSIYGDTQPAFSSGGEIESLKTLTYEDLIQVYKTYYHPSNCMVYLSGHQDIQKTLIKLDDFFKEYDKKEFDITFSDTRQMPKQEIEEYNITNDTRTVDIGFMSSGAMMSSDVKELYARDIIFNLLAKKMNEVNSKNYTSGGNTGGVSNLSLLVSEVPIEKKDETIQAYKDILNDYEINGFTNEELNEEIESYLSSRKNTYIYTTDLEIFNGITYANNPFYYTDISATGDFLKNNTEYFSDILKKYFTENLYTSMVVVGNGEKPQIDDKLTVTPEELEQIKMQTRDFEEWADAPDSPEVIAGIPTLTLNEVKEPPLYNKSHAETIDNITYYNTITEDTESHFARLYFPINVLDNDLIYIKLLSAFLNQQADKSGFTGVYFDMNALENYHMPSEVNPHFYIGISGENADIGEKVRNVLAFLSSDELWNKEDFDSYLEGAADDILANGYVDPYYISYDLMLSSRSMGKLMQSYINGGIGQGSIPFYHFLKKAEKQPELNGEKFSKIRELADDVLLNSAPVVEYVGRESEDEGLKECIRDKYKNIQTNKSRISVLPMGYNSAAVITNMEDANHFMLTGYFGESNYEYSGKMEVLGRVITSNYLLPVMRGKYGAYGAGASFDNTSMLCSVAGLSDIDKALEIWQGIGDFLKTLDITQKELDGIIISAIGEYDKYDMKDCENGAYLALCGKSYEDVKKARNEMLETTVEDLKSYADLVDDMVSQAKVFAVLGKTAADNAEFSFPYYANAQTLEITPMLNKNQDGYMSGKDENIFAPDEFLTRAEAAVLLSRMLIDTRPAQSKITFLDINEDDWFNDSVKSMSEKGIIKGYGDNTFRPGDSITRAEFANLISKFIYDGKIETQNQFNDVSTNHWAYESISKLTHQEIIDGYEDNTFRPDSPITRAESVTVINRLLEIKQNAYSENPFIDVSESHWAYEDIMNSLYR